LAGSGLPEEDSETPEGDSEIPEEDSGGWKTAREKLINPVCKLDLISAQK